MHASLCVAASYHYDETGCQRIGGMGGKMSYLEDLYSVGGKVALVTGAATGIGRMVATALVQGGARVLIASRKAEACIAVAEELIRL